MTVLDGARAVGGDVEDVARVVSIGGLDGGGGARCGMWPVLRSLW